MTRWIWLALVLALGGVQLGCEEAAGSNVDSDNDGVPDSEDCDDASPLAWRRVEAYFDFDKDGYGAGTLQAFCTGDNLPANAATVAGDCAPQDATRWRTLEGPGLYYADLDRDGRASSTPSSACVGTDLTGYTQTAGTDCNDSDPKVWELRTLYLDQDGDGVSGGEPSQSCTGNTLPAGASETSQEDCAPLNSSLHQVLSYSFRDADLDGATVPEEGTLCTGSTLPAGYSLTAGARSDCDDTRGDRWQLISEYPDPDRDSVGSGPAEQHCAGSLPEPGYSRLSSDCAPEDGTRWRMESYSWRDADGDGATVAESGQVCIGNSLPKGYFQFSGSFSDCDDTNAAVSVTWNVFADTDNDGVGAGSSVTLCAGTTRPAGYSHVGTDCEPGDASRWTELAFQYRDADLDSFTVATSGFVCTNGTLPPGYTSSPKGTDCDDTRADLNQSLQAYLDEDADGVGAGSPSTFCTNGSLPTGYASSSTDCAPSDALRWRNLAFQHVDADGDGRTTPSSGQLCSGSALPSGYATKATGNDCDDANAALYLWRVLYPDRDGDGVGVPPRAVLCLNDGPVPAGYSIYGFDPDDTKPTIAYPPEDEGLEALLLGE
ncbi:hypothetical protein [Archangium lansingense]|uniref:Lipoprotein n=1 Tax=Archangium lansingense TaxID=2995310 RepID=A0ABT4AM59_9BACT|nr:hypothetical protein [Archangium lansinium]MCY1082784.1 hypothetical protein [Archangium lansinium]